GLDGPLVEGAWGSRCGPAAEPAAAGRHRTPRVVQVVVRRLPPGSLPGQAAVAVERVRPAVTAEGIAHRPGAGPGPLGLVPPAVVAHHEELHRRLGEHARVHALEPVVEPAEHDALEVDAHALAQDAEVDVPVDVGKERAVDPGADDQPRVPGGLAAA